MEYKKGTSVVIRHTDEQGHLLETSGIITSITETTITLFHSGEKIETIHPLDTSIITRDAIENIKEITFHEETLLDLKL